MNIQIITPPTAYSNPDDVGCGLVSLTQLLHETGKADASGFGLGGEFGYGANYENDVFLLHRYCWCEEDSCLWCAGCDCQHDDCEYYLDGKRVNDWSVENDKILRTHEFRNFPTMTDKENKIWNLRLQERDRRLTQIYPQRMHVCMPTGLMADKVRSTDWSPRQTAPNFWHKQSGSKVWWYKWIGRDMETIIVTPWRDIMDDCYKSVAGHNTI